MVHFLNPDVIGVSTYNLARKKFVQKDGDNFT